MKHYIKNESITEFVNMLADKIFEIERLIENTREMEAGEPRYIRNKAHWDLVMKSYPGIASGVDLDKAVSHVISLPPDSSPPQVNIMGKVCYYIGKSVNVEGPNFEVTYRFTK